MIDKIINDSSDLSKTAKQFPEHAEKLIKRVLERPKEFKRLIKNSFYLRETAKQFPEYTEELIKRVLQNPKEFKRLIDSFLAFCQIAKQFPEHADELIRRILENPQEFKKLMNDMIYDHSTLCETEKYFPGYAVKLMKDILDNPKEFRRVIKFSAHLVSMVMHFPLYTDIFGRSSIEETISFIKVKVEIRKNARVLSQAYRTGTGFFGKLPPEINIKIAGLTGNFSLYNKKSAEELANKIFASLANLENFRFYLLTLKILFGSYILTG